MVRSEGAPELSLAGEPVGSAKQGGLRGFAPRPPLSPRLAGWRSWALPTRGSLGRMVAVRKRLASWSMIVGGLGLAYLGGGAWLACGVAFGVAVFVALPFWLGNVFSEPHAQRRR